MSAWIKGRMDWRLLHWGQVSELVSADYSPAGTSNKVSAEEVVRTSQSEESGMMEAGPGPPNPPQWNIYVVSARRKTCRGDVWLQIWMFHILIVLLIIIIIVQQQLATSASSLLFLSWWSGKVQAVKVGLYTSTQGSSPNCFTGCDSAT